MHTVFVGPPGTGKTSFMKLFAKILLQMAVVNNKLVEVESPDLMGTFVGQATANTRKKMKEATGGILSLDEAYGLNANSFGREAIDMLIKLIDVDTPKPDDPVVFFAGYADKMAAFIKHNSGMGRRMQHTFRFEA
ncbi:P-loop containing nucleoside triphosphate hydrolase protein [Ochromonadaceae sp. CCMP2298]|nr:P-loop containing nucleoside triphosphate hydrolase protein [Ochromonadaceae sp. CCMP2298]